MWHAGQQLRLLNRSSVIRNANLKRCTNYRVMHVVLTIWQRDWNAMLGVVGGKAWLVVREGLDHNSPLKLRKTHLNMMRLKQILRTRQLQLLSKTKPVEPEIRMSFILILSDLVYLSGGERGTGPQLSHTRTTRQSWTAVQPKRNQTHVFLYKRLTLRKLDKVVCDFITTNYLP